MKRAGIEHFSNEYAQSNEQRPKQEIAQRSACIRNAIALNQYKAGNNNGDNADQLIQQWFPSPNDGKEQNLTFRST